MTIPGGSARAEGVISVPAGQPIDAKQQIPYFVGISAATVGARGLSVQQVIIPPGGAAAPHIHEGYETAIYVIQGQVETLFGPGLSSSIVNGPGEFIYIAPGVPHQPRNLSQSEPAIAIVSRNNADEQERVIPYDPATA